MKTNELTQLGYVHVTGLTCKSYGLDHLQFYVPTRHEYPCLRHISGEDFIFLFLDNGQTWYKKIDSSVCSRASMTYKDGINIVCMDGRNPINTAGTTFAYPFGFDEELFERRKVNPNYKVGKPNGVMTSEHILKVIFEVVTERTKMFLKQLNSLSDDELIPFPNDAFLKAFDSGFVQDVPLPPSQIRNFYMLVILTAQREGRFPYNLQYSEFNPLITMK